MRLREPLQRGERESEGSSEAALTVVETCRSVLRKKHPGEARQTGRRVVGPLPVAERILAELARCGSLCARYERKDFREAFFFLVQCAL